MKTFFLKKTFLFTLTLFSPMLLTAMQQNKARSSYKTIATILWNTAPDSSDFTYNVITNQNNKNSATWYTSPSKQAYGNLAFGKLDQKLVDMFEIVFDKKEYTLLYTPKQKPTSEFKKKLIQKDFLNRGSFAIMKLYLKNKKQIKSLKNLGNFNFKAIYNNKSAFDVWCTFMAKTTGTSVTDINKFHRPFYSGYNNVSFFIGLKKNLAIAAVMTIIKDNVLYISNITINDNFKNKGYESKVLESCIDYLEDLVKLVITVVPIKSRLNYTKIGFKSTNIISALRRVRNEKPIKTDSKLVKIINERKLNND